MNKLPNMKLLPTTNPNYDMKESVEELIGLFKAKTVYIIDDNETIIGVTGIKNKFYEEEGFICSDIYYDEDNFSLHNYEWYNAEVILDKDMNIKDISSVVYKEKSNEIL